MNIEKSLNRKTTLDGELGGGSVRGQRIAPWGRLSSAQGRILSAVMALAAAIARGADPANQESATPMRPHVSEHVSPAQVLALPGRGGNSIPVVIRIPPGKPPFPAIVILHGGLLEFPEDYLQDQSLNTPTHVRFLAAGYVTVTPSFRSREQNPQTRDALEDCLTVIEHVKGMPQVDARSVVVMGGSGGGSLALELAAEAGICAAAAGEPASILFTGMMTKGGELARPLMGKWMNDPKGHYTLELQKFTREKIARIACPVFIAHGDQHAINKINHEIIVPEMRAAGKSLLVIGYPGQPHGFYFGNAGDAASGKKFFEDADAFFRKHLRSQPKRVPESAVSLVPLTKRRPAANEDPSTSAKRNR